MRRFRDRTLIIGVVLFSGALAWSFWRIWVLPSDQRDDAIGLGQLVLAAGGAAAAVIGAVWKWRTRLPRPPNEVIDLFAVAVKAQWSRAAGERGLLEPRPIPVRWQRSTLPLAGPVSAAVSSTRFAPLPGLDLVSEAELRAGGLSELHAVYGGLGSGRLVIVGAAGSGKSGAAILLMLDALQHRERVAVGDRPQVPVPVLFTLQGWDPTTQRLEDWLTNRLVETYDSVFNSREGRKEAAALLGAERLTVILDGLDEIAEALRPAALRALSQQAGFRVVVLSRSRELVTAASHARLDGAVALELQDVDESTAADYLTRVQTDPPPASWRQLTEHLHHEHHKHLRHDPTSPVSQALTTPLTLTLVRDTYAGADDVAELLDSRRFPSKQNVEDHLLDRVLSAAYARLPGTAQPRYTLYRAERTLCHLAKRMNQQGTRDLAWWRIPDWTAPATPRIILTGLLYGLGVGLLLGLLFGLGVGLVVGLASGLVFGFLVGLPWAEGRRHAPRTMGPLRWGTLIRGDTVVFGLVISLSFGLLFQLQGLVVGLVVVFGLGAGLVFGLMRSVSLASVDDIAPSDPRESWRRDRNQGLVVGLMSGLVFGLMVGLAVGLVRGLAGRPVFGLGVGPVFGLMSGLGFGLMQVLETATWATALACAQSSFTHRTPLRMIRFLEDARARNVLRTVGPVYQFRHARLQDRLADRTLAQPTA